ncbi:MAG TPA: DUF971 domain-containing protein [Cellvibrio sp.]|nr:DUF971 domain-containing protein [Cellvibrio sp.]
MNQNAPLSLNNSQTLQQLVVNWPDKMTQTFSHQGLRGACPCAKCRAARIMGKISLVDEDIKVVALNSMGYGIQMVFSDGHDRGIYPWVYLRELGCINQGAQKKQSPEIDFK